MSSLSPSILLLALALGLLLIVSAVPRFLAYTRTKKAMQAAQLRAQRQAQLERQRARAREKARLDALRLEKAMAPLLVTPQDCSVEAPRQVLLRTPMGWWSLMVNATREDPWARRYSPYGTQRVPTPALPERFNWHPHASWAVYFTPMAGPDKLVGSVAYGSGWFPLTDQDAQELFDALQAPTKHP